MTESFLNIKYNGLTDIISYADMLINDDTIDKKQALDFIKTELSKQEENRKRTIQKLGELSSLMQQLDNEEEGFKEIYAQMLEALDESSSRMEPGDKKLAEVQCAKLYGLNWSKLSNNTKQFLITAFFIRLKLKEVGLDFAPAIIEMYRAYENEIKGKIFNGYMSEVSSSVKQNDGSILAKALLNFSIKGSIDLSLKQMIIELSKIKSRNRTTYQTLLFNYVQNNGWNADSLSKDPFICDSLGYVDKFRNDAAHTTPFNELDSEKCQTYTEKIIRQFLALKEY